MSDVYEMFQLTCLFAARSITPDEGITEDAVHNAFMNLIHKKELLLLPDEELKALLIAIVKRRTIDLIRGKKRNMAESLDDMESIPSPEEPIEVQISTSEDFDRLTNCLKSLNESYRSILQLKYFSELSNTKIGEYLGITNRQVEIRIYKAKQKLRDSYYEEMIRDA